MISIGIVAGLFTPDCGATRLQTFVIIIVSYLLGSIPFGYLIVNAKTGNDIRDTGSGGTGATNVSRRAGKSAGILTLVLDALKGAVAILIARWLISDAWWIGAAGIAAMLGHIFPVWLRFRGGKGVATAVGVFAVLAPLPLLLSGFLFFATVLITRYVSLGSLLAAVSIPLFVSILNSIRPYPNAMPMLVTTFAGAILIIYAHRANIGRLVSGTESKLR
jgi:glycerol-3-phosphate acyltransferase PlsY